MYTFQPFAGIYNTSARGGVIYAFVKIQYNTYMCCIVYNNMYVLYDIIS